jgi:hypothetical protein
MLNSWRRAPVMLGILLALVALVPGTGDSAFGGSLRGDQPWTLRITPGVGGLGGLAVTVLSLTDGTVHVLDLFTTSPNAPDVSATYGPLPRRIKRVTISVAAPGTETYEIQIIQGISIMTFDGQGDAQIVFDIVR